jgi:hypothetical protein
MPTPNGHAPKFREPILPIEKMLDDLLIDFYIEVGHCSLRS